MPDLSGVRALVTGATSGIGESTALELAAAGADVIVAGRSPQKLDDTLARIRDGHPDRSVSALRIDVSELASVREAAAQVEGPLDILVNNAGVMATPYQRTSDGFELQFATNYLGPFALTGLLLPNLESASGRIVTTASLAHRAAIGSVLRDPRATSGRYSRWGSYARSKMADLVFHFELDRRLRRAGLPVTAVAAHPGYTSTGLMHSAQGAPDEAGWRGRAMHLFFDTLGQRPDMGALPTLLAAVGDVAPGSYVGPDGFLQVRGNPVAVSSRRKARDERVGRELWELSESATDVHYL